ncbi:hypothetical protein Q7C36_009806 [Tachysurus vachellii]|uniref:Uncharacterized protein n=1 Tax=Tachysurus vachellii TaxID=175792 RepID=A0AA88MZ15_TACVA|nr:hypothetical protein Q7C36_009806 [Tachysurus vachellii]
MYPSLFAPLGHVDCFWLHCISRRGRNKPNSSKRKKKISAQGKKVASENTTSKQESTFLHSLMLGGKVSDTSGSGDLYNPALLLPVSTATKTAIRLINFAFL